MLSRVLLALVALLAVAVVGELIPYKPCYSRGDEGKHCKVSNINIIPCPEIARNEPCKIKRGISASITFDFETDYDVTGELKSRAYWTTVLADLPFVGMDTDACKLTKCPVQKNTLYHYNYTLEISKSFPSQKVDTKWRLWEEGSGREKECCFLFKLKLI